MKVQFGFMIILIITVVSSVTLSNSSQLEPWAGVTGTLTTSDDFHQQEILIRLKAAVFDPLKGEPELPEVLSMLSSPQSSGSYYLVQFKGPITPDYRALIDETADSVYGYIPDYSFLVKLTADTKAALNERNEIRWIGPYLPAYKLHPSLYSFENTENIEVFIFSDANQQDILSKIREICGSPHISSSGTIEVEASLSQVQEIVALPNVEWIQPSPQNKLCNDNARWVIQSMVLNYTPVHDNGIHGENQLVAIADTGLSVNQENQPTHEMFLDSDDNVGPNHRKVFDYYVPAGAGGSIGDASGHGTHVAGTVAGDAPLIDSYNDYDGHAFQARIIMHDLEDASGTFSPPPINQYEDMFQAAYDNGARIHTNSWATTFQNPSDSDYDSRSVAIDNFMWTHKTFQILFAMANDGPNSNTLSIQAQAKNSISVGATGNADNAVNVANVDQWASSRGLADDNRIKPTVVAPGFGSDEDATGCWGIWSADSNNNESYTQMWGTSMATPAAAGAVTLVRQYYMEGWYPHGEKTSSDEFEPTSALIRATLINGAGEINGDPESYRNGNEYPNSDQGWGLVSLSNSLYFRGDAKRMIAIDNTQGLTTGDTATYNIVVVDNTQPLEFTLAWTDYPGLLSGGTQLVNNLNLRVIDPNNNVYLGNNFTSYNPGYSTTGGENDNLNVEEAVLLLPDNNHFPKGKYTIEVHGANVPFGENGTNAQPFALVVTGGIKPNYWRITTQDDFKASALVNTDADASPGDVVLVSNELVVDENTLALWHFDEGSGAMVYDEGPNNNDGQTILGPIWSAGKFDNALSYDNDDWVEVPNSASLNPTHLTIEAWVYARSFAAGTHPDWEKIVVAKGGEEVDGYYALAVDGGKPQALLTIGDYKYMAISPSNLELNRWYFLAMTYDGDYLKLYVDGVQKDNYHVGLERTSNDNNLTIGRQHSIIGTAQYFWDGLIDEVRIENRALSESEIESDNLAGVLSVDANTVALWHFDEGSGIWTYDSSPNNNDGGLHGARWTSGRFVGGSAPDFNGVNGTIWVPDSPSLSPIDGMQELGVEFWYYPRNSQAAIIVGKFNYGNAQGWFTKSEPASDPNKFKFVGWVGGGSDDNSMGIAVDDAAPLNLWAHLALIYDGENLRAYVNGEERSASYSWEPHGTFGGGPIESTTDALYIGSDHGGWDWVDGVIDEVRIENRILTSAEIAAHAEAYPQHLGLVVAEVNYHDTGLGQPSWGQISWGETLPENTDIELYVTTSENAALDNTTTALWHFDENILSKVFDSTPNHNDGTIYGNVNWTTGRYNTALSFPGAPDNYISVPHSSSLAPAGGLPELTVEAWVYVEDNAAAGILGKFEWPENGWFMKIEPGNSGEDNFRFTVWVGDGTNGLGRFLDDAGTLNQWTHLAMVWDGSDLSIFMNGENRTGSSTAWGSASGNVASASEDLFVGSEHGNYNFFKGKIDEVRISNVARSSEEILGRYENGTIYAWDNWTGPYTNSLGENITSASKQYIKWKAVLSSVDGLNTPVLHDVTVNWY